MSWLEKYSGIFIPVLRALASSCDCSLYSSLLIIPWSLRLAKLDSASLKNPSTSFICLASLKLNLVDTSLAIALSSMPLWPATLPLNGNIVPTKPPCCIEVFISSGFINVDNGWSSWTARLNWLPSDWPPSVNASPLPLIVIDFTFLGSCFAKFFISPLYKDAVAFFKSVPRPIPLVKPFITPVAPTLSKPAWTAANPAASALLEYLPCSTALAIFSTVGSKPSCSKPLVIAS